MDAQAAEVAPVCLPIYVSARSWDAQCRLPGLRLPTTLPPMARPQPALIALAAGKAIVGPMDEEALLASAHDHRMSGLLWSAVQDGSVELTQPSETALARTVLMQRHRQQVLWDTLDELTDRFATAGFELATLKGVTAEARWYDGVGERPSNDLDVLISPPDLARLEEYAAVIRPDYPLKGRLEEAVGAGLQSFPVWGPNGVAVDLHFDPLKLGIPIRQTDLVWSRTERYPTPSGREVRVLDPELSLIHFIFHVLKDRFSYLRGLVDITRLIEREPLDWEFIDSFLRTEGLEAPAYLTLEALYAELGRNTPPIPEVAGWRPYAYRALWPERIRLNGRIGWVGHHRRQLWIPMIGRGRTREGMAHLRTSLIPPPVILDLYNADVSGSYLRRLAVGRWRRILKRRETIAEMASSESTADTPISEG